MLILTRHYIFIFLLISLGFSQNNFTDIYSTQNLYGVKSLSLFGSNSSIINEPQDLFVNPATVRFEEDIIGLNIQPYILDTYFYHLTYGYHSSQYSNYVFGISGFVSKNFEERDVDGLKKGSYSNSESIVSVTNVRQISREGDIFIAATAKNVYSKLHDFSSYALLIDFAIHLDLSGILEGIRASYMHSDISLIHDSYQKSNEDKNSYRVYGLSYELSSIPLSLMYTYKSSVETASDIQLYGLSFDLDKIELNISYNKDINTAYSKEREREILNGFAIGIGIDDDTYGYSFAYRSMSDLGDHIAFGFTKTLN